MKMKASRLRTTTILAVAALIVAGLVFWTGTGTLSAWGYKSIAQICPLGSLETLLASKTFLPVPIISLIVVIVAAVVLGRVFCAWVCPVPLLRRRSPHRGDILAPAAAGQVALRRFRPQPAGRPSRIRVDSRHWVLGGALLSTAIFGFPVFCLICPIGLTFGTLAVLWRLLHFNEPSWSLLVFPAMLVIELVACRTWCRNICPLGALLSLMSSVNVFLRPEVDETVCQRTSKGVECSACKTACYEGIDLHDADQSQPLSECTKCRDCADVCPMHAVSFPFFAKKKVPSESQGEEQPCPDSTAS
jgi:ferredoxin-type protein NapH